MLIQISEIQETMLNILLQRGYSTEDSELIIDVYLGGELRGQPTHGLAPFPEYAKHDFSRCAEPEVILHSHSVFYIDAKGNSGIAIARRAADEAIEIAQTEGIGTAIIKNMKDWSRPGAIAHYVAKKKCIGVVTNIGSGLALAPPGGYDPTLGTNPIAFAFPTLDTPLEIEMATSKRAWGNIRIANKYGTDLPVDTFLTDTGASATKPSEAHSVEAFGGHKGFAISMLIAMLNGPMLGNAMLNEADATDFSKPWPPNSGTITVYDPELFGGYEAFVKETSKGIDEIKSTHPLPNQVIRIPGEGAKARSAEAIDKGSIEVPEVLWAEITSLLE